MGFICCVSVGLRLLTCHFVGIYRPSVFRLAASQVRSFFFLSAFVAVALVGVVAVGIGSSVGGGGGSSTDGGGWWWLVVIVMVVSAVLVWVLFLMWLSQNEGEMRGCCTLPDCTAARAS